MLTIGTAVIVLIIAGWLLHFKFNLNEKLWNLIESCDLKMSSQLISFFISLFLGLTIILHFLVIKDILKTIFDTTAIEVIDGVYLGLIMFAASYLMRKNRQSDEKYLSVMKKNN